MFSFGPLSNKRKQASINPVSSKPVPAAPVVVNKTEVQMVDFHNKDVKENFYTFSIPSDWKAASGKSAGSYDLTFPQGTGTVELMDVPDNSTLELFILSQQEPKLKKTIPGYVKNSFNKLSIDKNEAYELAYNSTEAIGPSTTISTYIAGPDQAVVITFHAKHADLDSVKPVFSTITNSFKWENVK
jgi:hypothetical protein